jgi:hypothetical protein
MKKTTLQNSATDYFRVIARNRTTINLTGLAGAGIAACLLLSVTNSSAQIFLPDTAFLSGINVDEDASFGATGTLNSIVADGNGFDYNVTFGTTGGNEGVNVDAPYLSGPTLNLSAFTDTEVNTKVLSGSATVVLFLQDGSAAYNFVQANGPDGQVLASGVLPLDYHFQPPFTPDNIIRYGFAFFGTAGSKATIEISAVPEPSSMALLAIAAMGGLAFIGRRK